MRTNNKFVKYGYANFFRRMETKTGMQNINP